MNSMNNQEQLAAALAKARELKRAKELAETVVEDTPPVSSMIPVVAVEENTLPEVFSPVRGLSLLDDDTPKETKESLMSKLAISDEAYSKVKLDADAQKRVRNRIGRMTHGASASVPITCRGQQCSYVSRCVEKNTEILLEDFKTIPIHLVTVGMEVYSVNQKTLRLQKKKVLDVFINTPKDIYKVVTESGLEVLVTEDHPFATYIDDKLHWTSIESDMEVGSEVLVVDDLENSNLGDCFNIADCFVDTVASIEYVKTEEVYDITIEDNHNFIGNSFVLHNCPFAKEGSLPVGEQCLVESTLAEYWTQKYMDDLDIDPNSIVEVHTLSRLVEISILENRVTMYMSIHEQDLTMDVITSFDDQGTPITNKAVSNAFDIREKLSKEKMKHLESLAATREKKAKLQIDTAATATKAASIGAMMNEIRNLASSIQSSQGRVVNG